MSELLHYLENRLEDVEYELQGCVYDYAAKFERMINELGLLKLDLKISKTEATRLNKERCDLYNKNITLEEENEKLRESMDFVANLFTGDHINQQAKTLIRRAKLCLKELESEK